MQFELDGTTVTIGGMCKGSGMIHPNMCTMLSFITTDICISARCKSSLLIQMSVVKMCIRDRPRPGAAT